MLEEVKREWCQVFLATHTDREAPCRPIVLKWKDANLRCSLISSRRRLRHETDAHAFTGHAANAVETAKRDARFELGSQFGRLCIDMVPQGASDQGNKMVFKRIGKANTRFLRKWVIMRSDDDKAVDRERSQDEAAGFDSA